MNVVGQAVAYAIVPLLEFDDTDDKMMVDSADPRNGSFLPHW